MNVRALPVLAGVAGTTALVALGLALSGVTAARVQALVTPALTPSGSLAPIAGPDASATHEVVTIDGEPTRVSRCRAPGLSPAEVLARYEALAGEETRPRRLPYLLQEDPEGGGGVLAWVGPEGARRTVLVSRDPRGGAAYRLLEVGLPTEPTASARRLPGGVETPPGCDVALSVTRPDGSGLALLDAAGAPDQAVTRLAAALAERGLVVDADPAARALVAASADGEPRTLTLRDEAGPRGLLVVTPAGGTTRVSLTITPPR